MVDLPGKNMYLHADFPEILYVCYSCFLDYIYHDVRRKKMYTQINTVILFDSYVHVYQ